MSQLPIDLDTESIQYEGQWYTRDELARRIKGMLDSGDFAVGKPSQALEQLTVTLASLRTITFKATPDLAEAINQAASRQGRGVGGLIREAISEYVGFASLPAREGAPPHSGTGDRPGKRPTEPELPAVVSAPAPAVIAGPGALKAAQAPAPSVVIDRNAIITEEATAEEAASAVSLNPKKKKKEEEENVERGWFGR